MTGQELQILAIAERHEQHRVAGGAPDGHYLPLLQSRTRVGQQLIAVAQQRPTRHQPRRLAQGTGHPDLHASHQHPQAVAGALDQQGLEAAVDGPPHPRQLADAAIEIVVDPRRLGEGSQGVLLHHPQVGAAAPDQRLGILHHAAIDPGHRHRHTHQQAQPAAGDQQLAPVVAAVRPGQVDHGLASCLLVVCSR